ANKKVAYNTLQLPHVFLNFCRAQEKFLPINEWGIWQRQIFQGFENVFVWGQNKLKCLTFVTQYIAFVLFL
ncbi:hypothetical protein IHV50_26805, partial [Escherichia coli]|uniref:hypothetical protein n=1 Tax=Escherichia coli TaxID=562 RepID=UPI001F25685E